jgi:hypothetical protein
VVVDFSARLFDHLTLLASHMGYRRNLPHSNKAAVHHRNLEGAISELGQNRTHAVQQIAAYSITSS